jgi:Ferredoxin subunits of nitrite reductase and ring-hydroxylating dioxygenases
MNRRKFIQTSCTACLSAAVLGGVVSSCKSTKYISGKLATDGLYLSSDEFKFNSKENGSFRSFIVVRNEALQYPICVYRVNDSEYHALWMQCTHQGAELQVSGNLLHCPAHGSEFSNKGMITAGPADKNLRTFPVTVMNNELFIDLRKV